MALFINAFNITMGNEGGYANNPDDTGGETYAGVSKNNWPGWAGWATVDSVVAANTAPNGAVNVQAVDASLASNTTVQTAVQAFYKANFWDTELLDQVNDQQLANQVFDAAVNMGTGTASKFLQQAVNMTVANPIGVDGQVGPQTLAAVNGASAIVVYTNFILLRAMDYQRIIDGNPTDGQFLSSWLSRMPPYYQIPVS